MSSIEERLTDQFYDWELYGRGWHVFDAPVSPEPPFRPFYGHYVLPEPIIDDGRRPTYLSSLVGRLIGTPSAEECPEIVEEEPEPELFERGGIVELQASLPLASQVSRESIEQLLFSLGHCREPAAFEIIGSHDSITAQFAASRPDAKRLIEQLEANFADGVFTQEDSVLEQKWQENENTESLIVQFGLSREFMLPIATVRGFGIDPLIGIAGALSRLEEGELGVFQVIFERVKKPWGESILRSVTDNAGGDFFVNVPELVKEAKNKISRPLYAAVMRMAAKAETYERALEIARNLAGTLAVFSSPHGNEFIPLENTEYPNALHEEDFLQRQSRRCGMILNSDELISLVHLPSSSVRTPKLRRESQKTKAAPNIALNHSGILFGENHHAGKVNQVRLTPEQRVRHALVIGASGTGKSTFLFNLIRQDIEHGQGLAVLDPHGDLIDKVCGSIPQSRMDDVILLDPSDEEFSIGFNILSAHSDLEKNLLASDLVSVFQRLSTSWGDQMGSVLNNAILAFLESSQGGTLADLRRFLIEPDFRARFLETVKDPDIVYYWKKGFPLLAGNKSIGSVLTRLDTFLSPKPIRYMVSQKENRLDFLQLMNSGKIILAKFSQGTMGRENSYLMGSLLVAKFHQAAMNRANLPESARRNFWLYIDEFHNFITPSMAEILTGARKYRVGLILAHQELRQLQRDSDVASAVLSQPYTRVCFRVGDDDARKLADGFSFFEAKDLQSLPNFEAICRVERADCDFNLRLSAIPELDEAQARETRRAVITRSREKYAVSREKLEEELSKARAEAEAVKPNAAKKEKAAAVTVQPIEPAPIPLPKGPPVIPQPEPKVAEQEPQPVAKREIVSKSKIAAEQPKPNEPKEDKGIGGHQHNLIRERIEGVAAQLGYTCSRENATGKGQKIDVVLANPVRSIACEIAITTTIDHEVGNVAKCIRGGFKHVAVLSPSADRLEKIQAGVLAALSQDEAGRIIYNHPDQFIAWLQELALEDARAGTPNPNQSRFGKYKIKHSVARLSAEEIKERESAALQMLANTMKKKKP